MSWGRRDVFVVVFLIFNSVIGVFSLLFGDRMWLLLEGSGISKALFQAYMVLVGICVVASLVLVLTFIFRRRRNLDGSGLVVPEVPREAPIVHKPFKVEEKKVAVDDGRRLKIFEEVEKSKFALEKELEAERLAEERRLAQERRPVIQPVVQAVDRNTYYDNGYMDEFGVFHEYEGG